MVSCRDLSYWKLLNIIISCFKLLLPNPMKGYIYSKCTHNQSKTKSENTSLIYQQQSSSCTTETIMYKTLDHLKNISQELRVN